MRLTVDGLEPVLAASARLLEGMAPVGASSMVRRTACAIRSPPLCRGRLGPQLVPKPTIRSLIERFRHRPAVKPVVRSLVTTAALLSPLAHSRTMQARKASDRELRGCRSSRRKAIFRAGPGVLASAFPRNPGLLFFRHFEREVCNIIQVVVEETLGALLKIVLGLESQRSELFDCRKMAQNSGPQLFDSLNLNL